MASLEHEELVELFRCDPLLAVEVTQRSRALALPSFTRAEVRPGELRDLLPTERRVDVVVLLSNEDPVFVLLLEVQTSIDPRKRQTWPYYLAALHAEHRRPVALVVCSPDPKVRAWAAEPIPLGHPGFSLKPVVVGPAEVPRVEDEAEARKAPYRAVLSALMHANEEGAERMALAAYRGTEALEKEDERDLWRELIALSLQSNEAARKTLEAIMNVEQWRDKSVWFKDGRSEGGQEEARAAIADMCELLGIELTEERRVHLAGLGLEGLRALRQAIKQQRRWPER